MYPVSVNITSAIWNNLKIVTNPLSNTNGCPSELWQAHRGFYESKGKSILVGLIHEVFKFHQKRKSGRCLPAYTKCSLTYLQNSWYSDLDFGMYMYVKDKNEILWAAFISKIKKTRKVQQPQTTASRFLSIEACMGSALSMTCDIWRSDDFTKRRKSFAKTPRLQVGFAPLSRNIA